MTGNVALVRRPSSRMAEGITTHIDRVPADAARAARQHEAYVAAVAAAGWTIREVAAGRRSAGQRVRRGHDGRVRRSGRAGPAGRGRAPGGGRREPRRRSGRSGSRSPGSRSRARSTAGTSCRSGAPCTSGAADGPTPRASASSARHAATRGRTVVPVRLHGVLHLKSAVTALPDGTCRRARRVALRRLAVPGDAPRARGGGVARDPDGRRRDRHGRVGPAVGGAVRRHGLRRRSPSTSASSRSARAASRACRCSSPIAMRRVGRAPSATWGHA